jgi:hypothetical protein
LLIREAKRKYKKWDEYQKQFVEQFGHIHIPQMLDMPDGVVTRIGDTVYKQTRSGSYTFLHVVHDHALLFFGEEYLEEQEKKSPEMRHPALQWMHTYINQLETQEISHSGAGAAWWRFANDLYTIRDNSTLQVKLRERLLDLNSFQGARHELWTTALFIAANFAIDFEDEDDNLQKHPEFTANDRETSAQIAVEAKSRHRKGVKGFSSGREIAPGEKVNIRDLVIDAYQKVTDKPLYVVIDVNLPPEIQEGDLERWLQEIDTTMNDLALEGYTDPCPANAIFFHNDPSHYMTAERIGGDSDVLWLKDYVAESPRIAHPSGTDIPKRVLKAHIQRLHPPGEIPEM